MALTEEPQDVQYSPSFLDALLCEEKDTFEDDFDANAVEVETNNNDPSVGKLQSLPLVLLDNDLFWEDEELVSLISKEGETHLCSSNLIADGTLEGPRVEAVSWISKVCAYHGFSALTAVLAVNYFDRFITSLRFERDEPWMTQLSAVACLSLAAKMEETHVPLLLDLQVEESRFVFEAKTIQRMELVVLSTLKWRMHPVTPISFFEHIVRRLGLKSRLHWEFLWRCERVLLNVIADSRVMSYLPSILAAATMIHVIKEIEPLNASEYIDQLLGLLKISEEQVNQCYKLIQGIYSLHHKRKRVSETSSPGGVIDASFSFDTSNDSWTMASSVSLSVEPLFKRRRAQDQQMRLPSVNRVSIDVLNSPH
ncbi:cyclin-D3-2-like [Gastrolobium bilobum]|uniref:cyclin-D3-2-like n=1 Tax=Gastrolobium bilobum TaxID=150636 RepID=UPI002AB216E2|nr:cyclin-D3-2-like [Gastrolobium bilobum]